MVDIPIPNHVKNLWDKWDIRVFVLFSLFLQTLLVLFASLRKRKASKWVTFLIWSAYLLADWVAAFALGLVSKGQDNSSSDPTKKGDKNNNQYDDLLAFWAPFLLLHLGGPDTITAFALEDNELWLRHLLGLLFQLFAASYVFLRSLPNNSLWKPTILMFISGIIKYAERTRALYLSSLDSFRDSMLTEPDAGPNYAKLMGEYSSKKDGQLPTSIEMIKEPDEELKASNDHILLEQGEPEIDFESIQVVQPAYDFFQTFKGLIVDLIFSFQDRNKSKSFFLKREAKDAFRVIEIELNFMYDVLYTKVVVIHTWIGCVLRIICFGLVLVSLLLFVFVKKHSLRGFDVIATYVLLIGAMLLDLIALVTLVFSDWTIVTLMNTKARSFVTTIHSIFPVFKRSRWSGSVSQYNLIKHCLGVGPKWVTNLFDFVGLGDYLDEFKYKSREPVTKELKEFIFVRLKEKSEFAKNDPKIIKEICSSRGDWVLRNNAISSSLDWSVEVEYDESLLLWHIATELCFQTGKKPSSKEEEGNILFCKLLSDYLLYLLVMQPTMMAAVAGIGQIRYRDTCAEAKLFFSRGEFTPTQSTEACYNLLKVNTDIKPADVKGDRSKSILFDACILAKKLEKLKEEKWKIISQVWVELLSYAASHCRANAHAQQLSYGGELLTFVWLLMAHLGLGEQFRIERGHARAKLIVGK